MAIQTLRGMKDIWSDDANVFNYIVENASKIAQKYGFGFIKTPLLEETNLFKRSVGDSSDIVNKEMYQFIDKGGNDVCLRPEGTAGVVRSFIQNKLDRAGGNHKFYYYGSMFRYERPQKGRLREFSQFGCESFGSASVYEDASVILMISEIFNFFEIKFELHINSLGCLNCMPSYKESLVQNLNEISQNLCSDCQNRIQTNPIRVLDCKVDSCKNLTHLSPKITDNLCQDCDRDFEELKKILKYNCVDFVVNKNLVRGLDYYNKTAFEFVSCEIGSQSAIAGGGRYDKLVEFLGGKSTPAVGFAIGIERILELVKVKEEQAEVYFIGTTTKDALDLIFKLGIEKRKAFKTHIEQQNRSFIKLLDVATKVKATQIAIVGQNEFDNGKIWIKNVKTQEEKIINIEEF
jgi:histidyl-tRNA synthetase